MIYDYIKESEAHSVQKYQKGNTEANVKPRLFAPSFCVDICNVYQIDVEYWNMTINKLAHELGRVLGS